MGAVTPATAVWDMANRLLLCVSERLAATPDGAPARSMVIPGAQVAWDQCQCGQLTVHTRTAYPSDNFPAQKLTGSFDKCPATWLVVEYVITVLRCVPVQDNRGNPPAPDALHAAAERDLLDRHAVRRGVTCCFADENPALRTPRLQQEQLAVGVEGQCMGSELHVLVALRNCEDC